MQAYKFTDKANEPIFLEGDRLDEESIYKAYNTFTENHVPKYTTLNKYVSGQNNIYDKINNTPSQLSSQNTDWRLPSPFGSYIVDYHTGNLLSTGVTFGNVDDYTTFLINKLSEQNDEVIINRQLTQDLLTYGVAYDIVFLDEDLNIKYDRLKPISTFMIYQNGRKDKPLAGCYIHYDFDKNGATNTYIDVYTKDDIATYHLKNGSYLSILDSKPHYFDGIPITEYKRPEYNSIIGTILPQIDAYDTLMSNLANFLDETANSILFVKGALIESSPNEETFICDKYGRKMLNPNSTLGRSKAMRDAKMITVNRKEPNGLEPDVKYIDKTYDVKGLGYMLSELRSTILTATATPDPDTDSVGKAQSAKAIEFREEQARNIRTVNELTLATGVKRRLKLAGTIFSMLNNFDSDTLYESINQLDISCPKHLFKTEETTYNAIKNLAGYISKQTLLELASLITGVDANIELERLAEETGDVLDEETLEEVDLNLEELDIVD